MCEDAPCCGCCDFNTDFTPELPEIEMFSHFGEDDNLADYNANEANDYLDE